MHFCSKCENMYYIRIDGEDSNKLIYYCRHCGHEEDNLLNTDTTIYKSYTKSSSNASSNLINQYTKLDPTLPRVNNILCPNEDCITNKQKKEREIIYIRYDEINMKYLYLCCDCDYTWEIKS
jgi:DNA-directed RNA polymerase subunit M/transcription elongation factor TFIIS